MRALVALNEATGKAGMSPISVLLNLLWIIFGGLWMAGGWMIAALIMAITIIGLPWTRAAFNIGLYTLLPFGQRAVSRAEYGLVAGARAPDHSDHAGNNDCRHPVCLGACEARWPRAVANRENDRTSVGCLPTPLSNGSRHAS